MKPLSEMRLLIIGLGQIGGSIGLDLVSRRLVKEVVGFDIDSKTRSKAIEIGAVDTVHENLESAIEQIDMIILAAPIAVNISILSELNNLVTSEIIVIDVSSTKTSIVQEALRLHPKFIFVGGHPIAGDEGEGIDSATKGKFNNRTFMLTPSEKTAKDVIDICKDFVACLEAKPLEMTAEKHDQLMALTSHLPYALAISLMDYISIEIKNNPKISKMIGGSLGSATRVAGSAIDLTLGMFTNNNTHLVPVIDNFIEHLEQLKGLIQQKNTEQLREKIKSTQQAHQKIK